MNLARQLQRTPFPKPPVCSPDGSSMVRSMAHRHLCDGVRAADRSYDRSILRSFVRSFVRHSSKTYVAPVSTSFVQTTSNMLPPPQDGKTYIGRDDDDNKPDIGGWTSVSYRPALLVTLHFFLPVVPFFDEICGRWQYALHSQFNSLLLSARDW